jgi:alkylation response protein AidB-like acyl-CoA dehydrogenase
VLHGVKTQVVNGPVADLFVITALTEPERGKEGISAFLVETGTPGLHLGPKLETFGMRSAPMADLHLEDCYVPEEQLMGPAAAGLTQIVRRVHRWERALSGSHWVGAQRALLDLCVAHARKHHEFGRSLKQSQALRSRLADAAIRLDLCRRLQARSAWLLDGPAARSDRDIASARLFLGRTVVQTTADALRVFGAEGHPVAQRMHRDATAFELLDGGTDQLRAVIAGSLLDLG